MSRHLETQTHKPMFASDPMINAFIYLGKIHKAFDIAADYLEDEIGTPTCISNCGVCCEHNTPPMMTIEAMNAISVLAGKGIVALHKTIDVAEDWLIEKNPFATLYEGMPIGYPGEKIMTEWRELQLTQCPFLSEKKQCIIHSVRPLVCRAYGVTRDSADVCPRPLGKGESITKRAYLPAEKIRGMVKDFREQCEKENKTWIISGMVPTLIYRTSREDKFRKMIHDNQIASAKVIGVDFEHTLMWQPQMDALRSGTNPDLVAAIR